LFGVPISELLAFPYQRLSLERTLPVGHVLKRMEDSVEPGKLWRFYRSLWRIHRSRRDFEGVVSRGGFKIRRIIYYGNSFLPVIEGSIRPRPQGGTRVEIMMRMHWLIVACMFVSASVPVVILTAALLHLNPRLEGTATLRGAGAGPIAFAAAMLCVGYCLCAVCFNLEARWARDLLVKIVDPQGTQSSGTEKIGGPLQRPENCC